MFFPLKFKLTGIYNPVVVGGGGIVVNLFVFVFACLLSLFLRKVLSKFLFFVAEPFRLMIPGAIDL